MKDMNQMKAYKAEYFRDAFALAIIHLFPKWPLFRYSFVFIQIRP